MIWGFAIWREFELWVAKEYSNNFVLHFADCICWNRND